MFAHLLFFKSMKVKIAEKQNLNEIMEVIHDAQAFLKAQEIDQWQNGYPNCDVILQDIFKQRGLVLKDEEEIVGYCFYSEDIEPTYLKIYDGAWINDSPYIVIHRLALKQSSQGKHLSHELFQKVTEIAKQQGIYNLRIDTHPDNKIMQHVILKEGFTYCGKIYLEDGDLRYGYQKRLN